ncbi:MAG: DUF1566 domain-containing protein [Desulfobacterales bacterium]|nr:DUF1566 domain-containing protein [Desulfobacterales bacterium]
MKIAGVLLSTLVVVMVCTAAANATLTLIGTATYAGGEYNLIYEDNSVDGGLVWLDYSGGLRGHWQDKVNWASQLGASLIIKLFPGYTTSEDLTKGWRLPSAGSNPEYGYNQIKDEMGHLFYASLKKTTGNSNLGDTTPFKNLRPEYYWTNTQSAAHTNMAWYFRFSNGRLDEMGTANDFSAMAVRPAKINFLRTQPDLRKTIPNPLIRK